MRTINSTTKGASWDEQTIAAVWRKGRTDPRYSPDVYRLDAYGSWMQRSAYGTTSEYGWEIDHVVPVSKGGADFMFNLQPLNWRNNRTKGDS